MQPTYFWHDYETWGANPKVDRPSQFAGVRTDSSLNIIDDPLVIYSRPPEDILPQPMATLVTGITPQHVTQVGLSEAEFIKRIHLQMTVPNTCSVGYNSLRFDDEVTRFTLFRNFYDPYEREWRNGNSRWDIIDMVRCVYALKPDGLEWPIVDNRPSFKLEHLTVSNNIDHGAAHDAYSDVAATIGLAKKIKQLHPALFSYIESLKNKSEVSKLIQLKNRKPLLHISSKFSAQQGCANFIAPIAMHPKNKNAVIAVVLDRDPSVLTDLTAEQIADKLYTSTQDLPEGEERLPIKCIHLNKSPVLLTPKILTPTLEQRLGLNKSLCEQHWQTLCSMDIASKLQDVFMQQSFPPSDDPEQQLYEGFINNNDKTTMQAVREAKSDDFNRYNFAFNDSRLNAMLCLYQARNHPQSLTETQKIQWHEHIKNNLEKGADSILSLTDYFDEIKALKKTYSHDGHKLDLLNKLTEYGLNKKEQIKD